MRVGLFGGTFSPPHLGHVRAARLFRLGGELDRLIIMPACIPPHKRQDAYGTPEIRLQLSRLAFEGLGEVSDYEICRGGASYTVDTLKWLRASLNPEDEIYLCVGEDMFLTFDTWKSPDEIFSLCRVLCLKRSTEDNCLEDIKRRYEKEYGAKICILPDEPFPVSSSEIRRLYAEGKSAAGLVPPEVDGYIMKRGVYKK